MPVTFLSSISMRAVNSSDDAASSLPISTLGLSLIACSADGLARKIGSQIAWYSATLRTARRCGSKSSKSRLVLLHQSRD